MTDLNTPRRRAWLQNMQREDIPLHEIATDVFIVLLALAAFGVFMGVPV